MPDGLYITRHPRGASITAKHEGRVKAVDFMFTPEETHLPAQFLIDRIFQPAMDALNKAIAGWPQHPVSPVTVYELLKQEGILHA